MSTLIAGQYPPPVAFAAFPQPQAVPGSPVPIGAVVVTAGPQGPAATASDYGFVRYDEVNSTPIVLAENTPAPFRFLQPVTVTDTLRAPFAGRRYLATDNTTLLIRKMGDSYLVRVRLSVVTSDFKAEFK